MKERVLTPVLLIIPIIIAGIVFALQPELSSNFQDGSLLLPISFILVYSIIGYWLVKITRINEEEAKQEGFESFKHKKTANQLGFSKAVEFENAKSLGFLSNNVKSKAYEAGFKSAEEMKLSWQLEHYQVKALLPKLEVYDINKNGNTSKTLNEIFNDNKEMQPIVKEIDQAYSLVSKTYHLQNEVMSETRKIKKLPILNIENSELDNLYLQTQRDYNEVQQLRSYKDKVWEARKEWLQPLRPLLTLIELTQDGYPIDLGRMSKVMQCTENQAEALLLTLLKDNQSIGIYDYKTQVYTKGMNISDDLKQLQTEIKQL